MTYELAKELKDAGFAQNNKLRTRYTTPEKLILHSNRIGDQVGTVKVLRIH